MCCRCLSVWSMTYMKQPTVFVEVVEQCCVMLGVSRPGGSCGSSSNSSQNGDHRLGSSNDDDNSSSSSDDGSGSSSRSNDGNSSSSSNGGSGDDDGSTSSMANSADDSDMMKLFAEAINEEAWAGGTLFLPCSTLQCKPRTGFPT